MLDEHKKAITEIELREIRKLIEENKKLILQQIELFYQGKPVKSIKK